MFDLIQSDSIRHAESTKGKIETTVNVDSNNVSAETFSEKLLLSGQAPAGMATEDFQTDRVS
jgi:hypothetical protein